MLDPHDYAANRLNRIEPELPQPDRRASGPKTEAGKRRSSQNAIRHGLSGRVVVLPTEDLSLYLKFSEEFVASLHPETPLERELAQSIADGYWRLKRIRTTEESLYALGHGEGQGEFDADNENIHAALTAARTFRDHSNAFVNLSIYEQRIQRGIEKQMTLLRAAQAERMAHRQAEIAEALLLRDLNRSKNLPWNPAEDQFVYSGEEMERAARRRDRMREALALQKDTSRVIPIQRLSA